MSKKKILIIGASSKIGLNLIKILKSNFSSNFEIFGTYNTQKIHEFNIVILTAALVRPIACEENKILAWKTNVDSVKKIVAECKKINSQLIFLSSDYVYSGKNSLIEETDSLDPLNYYGKTKLEGENLVLDSKSEAIIIRTSWLFSPFGNNFVKTILKRSHLKQKISVINDQRGKPTYGIDLAETIIKLIHSPN